MLQSHGSRLDAGAKASDAALIRDYPAGAMLLLGVSIAGWLFLAWLALDMGSPLGMLVMPMSRDWSAANVFAIGAMWSVMMVAMMLPSALPMIFTFVQLARRNGEHARAHGFVAAYVLVWVVFGALGTVAQWSLHRLDALDAMALKASPAVTVALLVAAGLYQFSPLKHVCLASCRSPFAFLIGEWRPGARGAFRMGLLHGLLCLGCCWALMALLFVGGVMNVPWVAALAVAVAIEKLAPRGERIANLLGAGLIVAAAARWLIVTAA